MKAIRYFVGILLFCGLELGLEAAERPGKEKKEKKPVPEFPFKRFYVDAYAGYSFPLASVELRGDDFDKIGFPPKCSMGEGLHVGINFAYRFNKYFALEIGGMYVAYLNTDKSAMEWGTLFDNDTVEYAGETNVVSREMARFFDYREVEGRMGQFVIQLVSSPGFSRWDPYVKAGIGFVAGGLKGKQKFCVNVPVVQGASSSEEVYHRGYVMEKFHYFRLGFIGAIGVNCHISKTISFFAEWQFSVYGLYDVYWDWGVLQSETGSREAAETLGIRTDRMVDRDYVSFSSHGLNFGIKFKF